MITLLFHYQLCSRFDFFQATGPKGEADIEQAAKRPKVGITADVGKVANPKSSNPTPMEELHAEMTDKNKCVENVVSCSPKTSTTMVLQQSTSLKQLSIRPLGSIGTPSPVNRYKLDNRPTAFRINSSSFTRWIRKCKSLSLSSPSQILPTQPPKRREIIVALFYK